MFKFNFQLDDLEDTDTDAATVQESQTASEQRDDSSSTERFKEHTLPHLTMQLPPDISYSPLTIVHPGSQSSSTLARRDLFDARYQLIASGTPESPLDASPENQSDLDFVEAPSDLVPGVYEGGLKTWECSVDLAAILHELLPPVSEWRSYRLLELGCGTAIPSLHILKTIFESDPNPDRHISIHLQDYNELVFRLVTLPNIILAWYMSPASASFRIEAASQSSTAVADDDADADAETDPLPPPDASQPGELPFTPTLLIAFTQSLHDYGVDLRFFSGSWETFDLQAAGGKYDVVLTSETIYRIDSLPSLLDLMWTACTTSSPRSNENLDELTEAKLKLNESAGRNDYLCIVAAKLVYFGVGGGVMEFVQAVEAGTPSRVSRHKGAVETIWKLEEGVKRNVMKVRWQ